MSKSLIIDYMPFQPVKSGLHESISKQFGIKDGYIVQGVLQRAGAKNQNGRIYPRQILQRECTRYEQEFIRENRALGELDHPESSVVNLNNVSHNILKVWWSGDELMGAVQILNTPSGQILKSLFEHGITLGISSRGLGSVKELYKESAVEVQDDFELIAWDFVSNPSTHRAYMKPVSSMNESFNRQMATDNFKYETVNGIITSILCENGNCRI